MVLNENECSDALYNANHRELHVSTLMGFCTNLIHVIFQKGNYTVMSRRITCSDSFLLALNKVLPIE